jgi:hypothetical protein
MERETEALLDALRRALARPGEHRLYRSGKLDGLFAAKTGAPAAAAARALREGLLETARTETKGRTVIEWVRVGPRGVDFLHEHESPLRALQELRGTLRCNQQALPAWLAEMRAGLLVIDEKVAAEARGWSERLRALEERVEGALRRLEAAGPILPREVLEAHPWAVDALNYLDRRRSGGAADDCPLPELFNAVIRHHPDLSVSAFHEGLRRLHERRAVLLRAAPSVADIAQPELALLEGAEVFYAAAR